MVYWALEVYTKFFKGICIYIYIYIYTCFTGFRYENLGEHIPPHKTSTRPS